MPPAPKKQVVVKKKLVMPPTPRIYKPRPPVPTPRTNKQKPPVPAPRTQVKRVDKALKGFTESYEIGIKSNRDPLMQLQHKRKYIGHLLLKTLRLLLGLKFIEALKVTFKKLPDGEIIYKTAYFTSKHKPS